MSKSWRQPHPEGRLLRKPQYEVTLEGELEEMSRNPEEIFVVMSEDQPYDVDHVLEEAVSYNRTEAGAWNVLAAIADGYDVDLDRGLNSFELEHSGGFEYRVWYITNGILED